MDDHCFAVYFVHAEAVGEAYQQRVAVRTEERRQVASMIWMRAVSRIVVHARVGKRVTGITAAYAAMNVEGEDRAFACAALRQSRNLRTDEYAAAHRVKQHRAADVRVCGAAANLRNPIRPSGQYAAKTIVHFHRVTSVVML